MVAEGVEVDGGGVVGGGEWGKDGGGVDGGEWGEDGGGVVSCG